MTLYRIYGQLEVEGGAFNDTGGVELKTKREIR